MDILYKNASGSIIAVSPIQSPNESWVALTPEEVEAHLHPPVVPIVPQSVSRAQGKIALSQAGLWEQVLQYADGITDPGQKLIAEVALNDTTAWERDSPFLNAVATALEITSEQMDALFIAAAEIKI